MYARARTMKRKYNSLAPRNATVGKIMALDAFIESMNMVDAEGGDKYDARIPPWSDIKKALASTDSSIPCSSYAHRNLSINILRLALSGGADAPLVYGLFAQLICEHGDMAVPSRQHEHFFIGAASVNSAPLLRALGKTSNVHVLYAALV